MRRLVLFPLCLPFPLCTFVFSQTSLGTSLCPYFSCLTRHTSPPSLPLPAGVASSTAEALILRFDRLSPACKPHAGLPCLSHAYLTAYVEDPGPPICFLLGSFHLLGIGNRPFWVWCRNTCVVRGEARKSVRSRTTAIYRSVSLSLRVGWICRLRNPRVLRHFEDNPSLREPLRENVRTRAISQPSIHHSGVGVLMSLTSSG